MLVTVRSPALFSLRHAAYSTLKVKMRGQDSADADARRRAWSRLATRVRSGLGCDLASDVDGEVFMGSNLDWMAQPNMRSFTALFSPLSAVECVRRDFFSRHPGACDVFTLDGFGELLRGAKVPGLDHNDLAAKLWEEQTEAILERSYARRKKKDDDPEEDEVRPLAPPHAAPR